MWTAGPWLGAVVWEPHRDFFKREAEEWQGRDPVFTHAAALPTKKPKEKCTLLPRSPAAQEEQKLAC